MRITLLESDFSTFLLAAEDGRTLLLQTDWDFPGVASGFGWSPPPGTPTDDHGNVPLDALSAVIADARDFLHERAGSTTDDPGYF